MVEYTSEAMEHILWAGNYRVPQHILHRIGPCWAIETMLYLYGKSTWRFFDKDTAKEEWERLIREARNPLLV